MGYRASRLKEVMESRFRASKSLEILWISMVRWRLKIVYGSLAATPRMAAALIKTKLHAVASPIASGMQA